MAKIVVAIPTFRRPVGLARLLDSLASMPTKEDVCVVVADNDAERREGLGLCAERQAAYRWPLHAAVVAERGIAAVRNALVKRALAEVDVEYIAMVDDDEWVEPNWLDALLATVRKCGADVVGGPVISHYETAPAPWISASRAFERNRMPTGRTDLIDKTNNTLFSARCFTLDAAPRFDVTFGLTGGEDKELLTRLKKQGVSFAWCDEAVVCELVPASRMTKKWVLLRAYRVGNSDMRIVIKHRTGPLAIVREIAKACCVLTLCPIFYCFVCWSPGWRLNVLRRIWRAAGKIGALVGHNYRAYLVVDGR